MTESVDHHVELFALVVARQNSFTSEVAVVLGFQKDGERKEIDKEYQKEVGKTEQKQENADRQLNANEISQNYKNENKEKRSEQKRGK